MANAGFKLRVLAFDRLSNMLPLVKFTDPDKRKNIDIVACEDKLRNGQKFMEVAGLPEAFSMGHKMLDQWKYKKRDGTEVDLGSSKTWGTDTIVVLDSITAMGVSAKRRAMAMLNKTPLNSTQQMWGLAMADQESFIEKLTGSANHHHVIVTSHLKIVGPKDVERDDGDVSKEIKARALDLVPTRLYPSALGQALPPVISQYFHTVLLLEVEVKAGGKVKRFIRTQPRAELDLKVPSLNIPASLPIEDGILTVLDAVTGGIKLCFASAKTNAPKPNLTKETT